MKVPAFYLYRGRQQVKACKDCLAGYEAAMSVSEIESVVHT